jgi:dehydrogenase/reductase SDR family protein 12
VKAADLVKIVGFYGRFTPNYSRLGFTARRLGWNTPTFDFTGQRWLVTGASGGIGAAIVAGAAGAGADVLAVARSASKLEALQHSLDAASRPRVETKTCDLASVAAIDALLGDLAADGRPINVLVNNVGVLLNEFSVTPEGFETSYVTNLLGHYQLTEGIIDAGLFGPKPLILNMSSGGLYNVPLNTRLLNVTDAQRYGGKAAYAAHKRGQVALSGLWDDRLQVRGGRSYVLHPGWVRTAGVQRSLPVFYRIQGAILRSPAEGADTALWLAATRPDRAGRHIWFDREVRPQHVFPHTRTPECSEQDLFDALAADLAGARA